MWGTWIDGSPSSLRVTSRPAFNWQLGTFKAVLNHAVKVGLLERNPADAAEPIRGIEGRQRFLGPDDLKSVFDAANRIEQEFEERLKYKEHEIKGWLPDFVLWAVHSGMRRQEILNIRLGDIIAGANGKSLVHIAHTKSGKPRNITCTDEMLAIIKRLKKLRRTKGDDRLFPVSLTTAKRKLNKLWRASGIEDVRLHDLRRTHATELVKGGVNLREVAGRLGHRDLAMLEKHYAVYLGDDEAAAAAQTAFASFGADKG